MTVCDELRALITPLLPLLRVMAPHPIPMERVVQATPASNSAVDSFAGRFAAVIGCSNYVLLLVRSGEQPMGVIMRAESALPIEASATASLDAGHEAVRAVAGVLTDPERSLLAPCFGVRTVSSWWRLLTARDRSPPTLRVPFMSDDSVLPTRLRGIADDFGMALATLGVEDAACRIGRAYSALLPPARRTALGIYYTPPALAGRLLDQATACGVDWATARILDPACGGGAFLVPVAERILARLDGMAPAEVIRTIGTRIRGRDIDPFGAWLSQVALDAVMLPYTRDTGTRLPVVVETGDTLRTKGPEARFDLVVGNPPYGRVRLEPEDRARFKRSLYGHANLYGLFMDVALRQAKPGGLIAYVTPTSFLAGRYFKNLRALLCREAPPATMDFIAFRKGVFEDVLQETLLTVFRRGAPVRGVMVNEVSPAPGAQLGIAPAGEMKLPSEPSQPWLLPRTPLQAPLVARLGRLPHRLADWGYTISTGPLVWNRFKGQLAGKPGRARHPLIWAEAVGSDGHFRWRAERRNHAPWFETRPGDEWLLVRTPCVLVQRTTAKEQRRRLIAAPLPAAFLATHEAVVVENHLNMVRPTGENPAVEIEVLSAFLNSAAADHAFRCVSGSVAVSAYELAALPLPSPEKLDHLSRLVAEGAGSDLIEAASARLYG